MPFTPFHMGSALALKAVAGRRFSVLVFGITQVVIDVEVLVRNAMDSEAVHGPMHSYALAGPIAIITALVARKPCTWLLNAWNRDLQNRGYGAWQSPSPITRTAAWTGALFGTFSHVFIDSLVHYDIEPWWPWSTRNGLQAIVSEGHMIAVCIALGMMGVAHWYWSGNMHRTH